MAFAIAPFGPLRYLRLCSGTFGHIGTLQGPSGHLEDTVSLGNTWHEQTTPYFFLIRTVYFAPSYIATMVFLAPESCIQC